MAEAALKTQNVVETIAQKTIDYLNVPCIVGHEQYFLNYLMEEYQAMDLTAIRHEGLLEVYGSRPRSAIICAHIDRHGLISIGHGEYVYAAQYVKEIKYGQNNRASQKEIANITKRFEGEPVYAFDPQLGKKLGVGTIRTCDPEMLKGDALFEVEGLDGVELGFPLAYARTARVENGFLKGQIDNALSLSVVSALFANGFEGTALLTTEEEIGKSWTHLAAWLLENFVRTQDLIVLDTSPYNDPEAIEKGMLVFRNRDMNEKYSVALVQKLKQRADALKIPYQVKDEVMLASGKTVEQLGSTELGKLIQGTKHQWSGATVQVPTMMYHTSNETTSLSAINAFYGFLRNILMEQPLDLNISIEPLGGGKS